MRAVTGVVQHYAWGDPQSIPHLLGEADDGRPWAEWWVGTHPMGPSTIDGGASLESVSGTLPYLVKFLAAADALSLQTHPDVATAVAGFEREQAGGIAFDDPRRVYRDPHAKPELICALTEFDALCGFRPAATTIDLLRRLGLDGLASHLERDGLPRTVAALYRRAFPIDEVVRVCAASTELEAATVATLAERYPGDPSVVVTLLLNRVRLRPFDALFLGPGNLHAYLRGTGVEVMGASDNVVRGGLTTKHVDVEELLRVLSYEPLADPVVRLVEIADGRWRYESPGAPFELTRIDVVTQDEVVASTRTLAVCSTGAALGSTRAVYLAPGESLVVDGPATIFAVAEPTA